jgi:hypothetical protein
MVDRPLHEAWSVDFRRIGGGISLVDCVTLALAARDGIGPTRASRPRASRR